MESMSVNNISKQQQHKTTTNERRATTGAVMSELDSINNGIKTHHVTNERITWHDMTLQR